LFWFPDWLIDWSTVASPNACCGCGIVAPPTPIKDIADSSSAAAAVAAVAAANIASLGYFRFLFPEFPVEGILIVGVHTLTVNNMKRDVVFDGLVFEFEIRFLDSEF
jgi:hypothetical protein